LTGQNRSGPYWASSGSELSITQMDRDTGRFILEKNKLGCAGNLSETAPVTKLGEGD